MTSNELAQRLALIAKALIPISVFVVMVCLSAGVALFTSCWVLYGLAWWMEERTVGPSEATGPTGPTLPFIVPR